MQIPTFDLINLRVNESCWRQKHGLGRSQKAQRIAAKMLSAWSHSVIYGLSRKILETHERPGNNFEAFNKLLLKTDTMTSRRMYYPCYDTTKTIGRIHTLPTSWQQAMTTYCEISSFIQKK